MEESPSLDVVRPPIHTNTFGIPNESGLLLTYQVYKPSPDTLKLKSEWGRRVFSDVFIENTRLGTLSDLCVRSLAAEYGMQDILPIVSSDPLKMRIHYDSLSVDLPLEQCHQIEDELYWRRVVLSKHPDKTLAFAKTYPWKNVGISLKFVELVESCAAEYWPEDEMNRLMPMVREYITEMHIRKLQALQERSFEQYLESESDDDDDDDDYYSDYDLEEEDEESSSEILSESVSESAASAAAASEGEVDEEEGEAEVIPEKTEEELREEARRARVQAAVKAIEKAERLEELRREKEARRKERAARRAKRARRRARRPPTPPPVVKKKKPVIKGVFDIEIEEDEDDGEADAVDRRNLEKCLRRKKKYEYPPEHCHHINLQFLREFVHLTSLTIEFNAPPLQRDYHTKHFNFSYQDMENLGSALLDLQLLQTFRLINSRMDARKLRLALKALQTLPHLETLDFSYDQLQDDCGGALYVFFANSTSIKSLELKGNEISSQVLTWLAQGLDAFEGTLEYLGLGGNRLHYDGLHALFNALLGTQHVKHLSLRGAHIDQEALVCCVANELIMRHEVLHTLDLAAVFFCRSAGVELIKALATNQHILELDCRDCNLDEDVEFEVSLIIKRNHYIVDNPYIGDDTKTEEEINAWVDRVKNPILLHAWAEVEKRAACRANQPDEFRRYSVEDPDRQLPGDAGSDVVSLDKLIVEEAKRRSSQARSMEGSALTFDSLDSAETRGPFVYDPNNFTQEEFYRHVFQPGPGERFYFFQEQRRRGFLKDHSKD